MISRRKFIGAALAAAVILPIEEAFAKKYRPFRLPKKERILDLYNIHTEETIRTRYFAHGIYDRDEIDKLNYFLRCHYTGEVIPIDIKVIDLMCDIKDRYHKETPIKIISGYRSPRYNELLINEGHGVSSQSLHLKGMAIDFEIDGIKTNELSLTAKTFQKGGVGKYDDFVHIDVGRIRYWHG